VFLVALKVFDKSVERRSRKGISLPRVGLRHDAARFERLPIDERFHELAKEALNAVWRQVPELKTPVTKPVLDLRLEQGAGNVVGALSAHRIDEPEVAVLLIEDHRVHIYPVSLDL